MSRFSRLNSTASCTFVLFLISLSFKLQGQVNLITNPSFEGDETSIANSCVPIEPINGKQSQSGLESLWLDNIIGWEVLDAHGVVIDPGLGGSAATADRLCSEQGHRSPRTGEGCLNLLGGENRDDEHITQRLVTPLSTGSVYYYEYYVKTYPADPCALHNSFGIRLSLDRLSQHKYNASLKGAHIYLGNSNNFCDSYTLVSGFFIADQAYQWVTLGRKENIPSNQLFRAVVDDVSLYELNSQTSLGCPNNDLHLENMTFGNQASIHKGVNELIAGEDVGQPMPNGPVRIIPSSSVTFQAGQRVILEEGFTAEFGSNFLAWIAPCETNPCFEFSLNLFQEITHCGTNSIQLSPNNIDPSLSYSWSPSIHLSSINSGAVSFTPPSNQIGTIDYTVTITDLCGNEITETIRVKYNSQPFSNPSVNLSNVQQDDYEIDFDINVGASTEEMTIEIFELDGGNQTLVFSETYLRDIDFFGNIEHVELLRNAIFKTCLDYRIVVSVRNRCETEVDIDELTWNKTNLPLSIDFMANVLTPDGDGVNDYWVFQSSGAFAYTISVYNRWDHLIYVGSGIITSGTTYAWDGRNNNGTLATEGVYAIILTIFDGCGNQISQEYETVTLIY